jgi:hypothetical protein
VKEIWKLSDPSCLAQCGLSLLEASIPLKHRTPEGPIYRIARGSNPWAFPDWSKVTIDSYGARTFGSRFDDPAGEYRVLYASSQVLSCYVETLARFRPDYLLKAELAAIKGEDDFQPIGYVSLDWFENRYVGRARAKGRYADIYTAEWVSQLRPQLQPECRNLGMPEFDLTVLMQAQRRIITQMASNYINELGSFSGIYYASRYGNDLENWALFESKAVFYPSADVSHVSAIDPMFLGALEILQLQLPEASEQEVPRAKLKPGFAWVVSLKKLITGKAE